MTEASTASLAKYGDWNTSKQAHTVMVLDKARSEMSTKVDVDPNDPSPESLIIVAGEGGGEQKLLKHSQKKPPQAAASKRTFHPSDLKYISAFLKNNKSNIVHDQASSEQQIQRGLNSNHNNINNNNNCDSHDNKKGCRSCNAEKCCNHKYNNSNSNRDDKTNINNGGRSNPCPYYQGRLGNPPCFPRKLHVNHRRGAASCATLQENHATAPKFGEWNYLKKAMEYTDIFDKLLQEKKARLSARVSPALPASSPPRKPSQGSTTKDHHKNSSWVERMLSFM